MKQAPTEQLADAEARQRIEALMRGAEKVYPSDIADQLHLDYEQVLRVLAALQAEGFIENAS